MCAGDDDGDDSDDDDDDDDDVIRLSSEVHLGAKHLDHGVVEAPKGLHHLQPTQSFSLSEIFSRIHDCDCSSLIF